MIRDRVDVRFRVRRACRRRVHLRFKHSLNTRRYSNRRVFQLIDSDPSVVDRHPATLSKSFAESCSSNPAC